MKRHKLILLSAAALILSSCGSSAEERSDRLIPPPSDGDDYSTASPTDDLNDELFSGNTESVGSCESAAALDAYAEIAEEPDVEEDVPSYSVHFLCAGDNLIHDNIFNEARNEDGTYDFSGMYELAEPYVSAADIAVLNQESLVTGAFAAQSYPVFATPTEVGDAVCDIGFNVISMANNHVLDKGTEGLISSLDYWDTKDVVCYGAYRSEADSQDIRTLEVNGITFAFLGYTEHTNGISLSGEAKVIYLEEEELIRSQIEEADEIADVVVVSCHYGTEVEHELNDQQKTLTPELVEWGADLIIGTQSHCVSTCGYIDKPDGGQAFVFYGLGNFFHTMYDYHSAVGIMGDLDIVKDPESGDVTFENISCIPVISHYEGQSYSGEWYNCKLYPLSEYTDELFAKNYNNGVTRSSVEECLSFIPEEFLAY